MSSSIIQNKSKKFKPSFLIMCLMLKPSTSRLQIDITYILKTRDLSFKLVIVYDYYDVVWKLLDHVTSWTRSICNLWSSQQCCVFFGLAFPHASLSSTSCLIVTAMDIKLYPKLGCSATTSDSTCWRNKTWGKSYFGFQDHPQDVTSLCRLDWIHTWRLNMGTRRGCY